MNINNGLYLPLILSMYNNHILKPLGIQQKYLKRILSNRKAHFKYNQTIFMSVAGFQQ